MSSIDFDLIKKIWDDANFVTSKKSIKQTGEANKKDSIRRLNQYNKIVTNCKVCNCEMYISTNYSGEFPLCERHRDPNNRPLNTEKFKSNKVSKSNQF